MYKAFASVLPVAALDASRFPVMAEEYWSVAPAMIDLDDLCRKSRWHPVTGIDCTLLHGHEVQTGPTGQKYYDNRIAWKHLLHPNAYDTLSTARAASTRSPLLPVLIRCYIAVNDGEPQVERDIGGLREFLEEHSGPNSDQTVDDGIVLHGSGLIRNDGGFSRTDAQSGLLVATEFTCSCTKLWRDRHGNRFGYYRNSGFKGNKKKRLVPMARGKRVRGKRLGLA